jgi:heat shock protein HslJ
VELARERTASGARYVSPDGGTSVWTKGNTAMVEIDGAPLAECQVVPPDVPASWRARGNEPGWSLTLEGGRFTFVNNYGADTSEGMMLAPSIEAGAFVYDVAEIGARIGVAEAVCHDDMTGMPYPQAVTIETGGRTLRGCGGEPIDLLRGAEWVVEDIAGTGLIDSSRVTMAFGRDGGLYGTGGCNRYTGGIEIGGEAVTVGPVAATMMACAEALMVQERRFFEALERIDGFDIDETGALKLLSVGQPVLTARR